MDFLCSIGLLKHDHSRSPNAVTVVSTAWDQFINNGDHHKTFCILNGLLLHQYGEKSLLHHQHIDQFNGKITILSKAVISLNGVQKKNHKKITNALLSCRLSNLPETLEPAEAEEVVSSDSDTTVDEQNNNKEVAEVFLGEFTTLNAIETPLLAKLFGG